MQTLKLPKCLALNHVCACSSSSNGAGLHDVSSRSSLRGPLDDKYIWRLVLNEQRHLTLAGMQRCCLD
jgi:hypothetical protein